MINKYIYYVGNCVLVYRISVDCRVCHIIIEYRISHFNGYAKFKVNNCIKNKKRFWAETFQKQKYYHIFKTKEKKRNISNMYINDSTKQMINTIFFIFLDYCDKYWTFLFFEFPKVPAKSDLLVCY